MQDGLVSNFEQIWTIDYDDLELGRIIGKGAFGQVYLANYFGTEVAVKKLGANDEEDELYLQREVGVLKSIRHPNVVTFMGVCKKPDEDNTIYIVTEFVTRGSLRQLIKEPGTKMSWTMRGRLALDIACALAYLHSRNIIFRDLKSKNILVDENYRAKICDFGFARLTANTRGAKALTLCGTDDWMAPEVILGMDYDGQCDVFSYGIVLFELITRKKVSEALQRSPMDAFDLDQKKTRALVPADCPPEFADLAFLCCRYEPDQRPSFKHIVRQLTNMVKTFEALEAAPPPVAAVPAPAPAGVEVPSHSAEAAPAPAPAGSGAPRGGGGGRGSPGGAPKRGGGPPPSGGAPRGRGGPGGPGGAGRGGGWSSPRGGAAPAARGAPAGAAGAGAGGPAKKWGAPPAAGGAPAPAAADAGGASGSGSPTLSKSGGAGGGGLKMAPPRNTSESVVIDASGGGAKDDKARKTQHFQNVVLSKSTHDLW